MIRIKYQLIEEDRLLAVNSDGQDDKIPIENFITMDIHLINWAAPRREDPRNLEDNVLYIH